MFQFIAKRLIEPSIIVIGSLAKNAPRSVYLTSTISKSDDDSNNKTTRQIKMIRVMPSWREDQYWAFCAFWSPVGAQKNRDFPTRLDRSWPFLLSTLDPEN